MRRTSRDRRAIGALGLSLALHALLLGWLAHRPIAAPAPVVETVASLPAVDFEVAVPEAILPAVVVPPRRKHPHSAAKRVAESGVARSDSPGEIEGPHAARPIRSPGVEEARRLELRARLPDAEGSEDFIGGTTFRPGKLPPELSGELLAGRERAETRQTERRITGWLLDDAARRRVDVGLVDPYYNDLALALRTASAHPPMVPIPGGGFGPVLKSWADQSARYGATGNPYSSEESPGRTDLPDLPGVVRTPSAASALLDDLPVSGLVAVVEITQLANGLLEQSVLLRSSGSGVFDAYVLDSVPVAISRLVSPPDGGLGLHADHLRSIWSFQGKTSFEKRWKDFSLVDDGWYFLATLPLVLSSARFDEVTGEGGFVDLRHPKMKLDVKLLRVY